MFLRRFLKSKGFQAPYFQAVSMFKAERLGAKDDPFLPRDFIECFSCKQHAFMSMLIFMHRMAVRRSDEALIKDVTDLLQRGLNLGWFIGQALRPVGSDNGMLVGGVRWLGLLPIVKHDPQGFRSYLRKLNRSDQAIPDVGHETETWGCASIQIALILLERFGFGSNRLIPLMRALTTKNFINSVEPVEESYRVAEIWIRYMLESRTVPSIPLQPAFYLGADHISAITERVLRTSKSATLNWLSTTPSKITAETAPQLFCSEVEDTESDEPWLDEETVI
jgi:hypothetical protein